MTKGSKVVELSDDTFYKMITENEFVLVEAYADWCQPCQKMKPILEDLSNDLNESIIFTKIDVDKNEQTTAKYEINSIPTILFFHNGEKIAQIVGATTKSKLKSWIENRIDGVGKE